MFYKRRSAQQYKSWRAAYFTLEASLLVPMVLCIIVMLIHLSYLMYQKTILTQDTYLLGFRATVLGKQEEMDMTSYVQGTAQEQFQNRYIGSELPQVKVSGTEKSLRLEAATQADHAAMSWHELMPEGPWGVVARSKAEVLHRGNHIRRIDRLVDLGKQLINESNEEHNKK